MLKSSTAWFTTIASWTRSVSAVPLWAVLLWMAALSLSAQAQVQEVEIVGSPQVYGDRVTLRARTKGADDRPVLGLEPSNFGVIVDGQPVSLSDWKSPREATPPPAWVVILLDFSGSMEQPDSSNQRKLNGAVDAIRQFTQGLKSRAGNTQVSIVPFGIPGKNCDGAEVNPETLNRFSPADDAKLDIFLDNLLSRTPCASTDLYNPIIEASEFLTDPTDPRFSLPEDSNEPEPRLSIILLSDGFHNNGRSIAKPEAMERLTQITARNRDLVIHTLGYGLTPEELGQKYGLSGPATIANVTDVPDGQTPPPGKIPAREFVDQQSLAEIAELTGGLAEFSGDARKISDDLQLFLDALLGEYQLDYIEPNPERGSKHDVKVVVDDVGGSVTSESKPYITEVFGRSLPASVRMGLFTTTLLSMIFIGVVPFWFWAQRLKKELE